MGEKEDARARSRGAQGRGCDSDSAPGRRRMRGGGREKPEVGEVEESPLQNAGCGGAWGTSCLTRRRGWSRMS